MASETKSRLDAYANLSTAHVTPEIADVLDATEYESSPAWRHRLSLMSREYGWFIRVPDLQFMSADEYADFPECLRACFDLARDDGAVWILFDRDEEAIESLPIYEW